MAIALAALAAVALAGLGVFAVPGYLNPFAPLRIDDPVGILTRMKISRLEADGPQCRSVLNGSKVVHRALPDRSGSDGCGLSNGVDVERSEVAFNRGFVATCPLTVAWAMFETHVLQEAARQHLGQDVVRVVQLGTYACRNINHSAGGRRSQHATANAIDVSAFILADGRQISVLDDWEGGDPRRTAFLRAVRDGACRFFDVVLGPDYNSAHRDHFHFDMGPFRSCR
ncbi:extensin-like domain-containing protein [Microvirga pudoricolor]|uniref:extensin-like domain-containing protein n=1 Tax=Microvirga pudoricolor TaxID=2778729 RepID=UPI00194FC87A|nr:extensin family protein [Microvirga pudoricolor]MBM6592468.1 extensin family protein [Microvirga pudoricolor]